MKKIDICNKSADQENLHCNFSCRNVIKNYWPIFILVVSIMMLCFTHALRAGLYADFSPMNGDFQNFNVVRRLLRGETAFEDFAAYLGCGHLLLGTFFNIIFGNESITICTSKVVFRFLTILSTSATAYVVFWAVFYKKSIIIPLVAVNLLLSVLVILSHCLRSDFTNFLLYSGNSARCLRSIAPVIFIGMYYTFHEIFKKMHFLSGRINRYIDSVLLGSASGVIIYYSNDYGISSAASATFLFLVATICRNSTIKAILQQIVLYILALSCLFVLFGLFITKGHLDAYLAQTLGTGGAQGWYYLSQKSHYLWELDYSFGMWVQFFIIIIYLLILIRKGWTRDNIIRYGILLFINMTSFAAANEYKLFSGDTMHTQSYVIVCLTLASETLRALLYQNSILKSSSQKRYRIITSLVALVGYIVAIYTYEKLPAVDQACTYVQNLGYFNRASQALSILSTDDFLKENDCLFSTYASATEVYRNCYHPSGIDYIIHVLGNSARQQYIDSLHATSPDYISTVRETYSAWEYWVRNANWFFYRELYSSYEPVYANAMYLYWKKIKTSNKPRKEAIIYEKHKDGKAVTITVIAPEVSFGSADILLQYKVKKEPTLASFFMHAPMVCIENTSSYQLTNNSLDSLYYQPKFSEGSGHTIGVTIVNGKGSVIISTCPNDGTYFDFFQAKLVDIYDGGYFDSLVVVRTVVKKGHHSLLIENTPTNRQVLNGVRSLQIGSRAYPFKQAITPNKKYIEVTTPMLDADAIRGLTGHKYFPIIKVIRSPN